MRRYCNHCGVLADDVRLVRWIDPGTGPGAELLACRTCVPHCDLDREDDR